MNLVREPDAGNPPVRFDEREVETEHGMRLLRHRRGNPDPEYAEAYPTAPPLDSTHKRIKEGQLRRFATARNHTEGGGHESMEALGCQWFASRYRHKVYVQSCGVIYSAGEAKSDTFQTKNQTSESAVTMRASPCDTAVTSATSHERRKQSSFMLHLRFSTQSRGSTGSLSNASTPNTHSWTRRSGSRLTKRSRDSIPKANSRSANDLFVASPRCRNRLRFSGKVYSGP